MGIYFFQWTIRTWQIDGRICCLQLQNAWELGNWMMLGEETLRTLCHGKLHCLLELAEFRCGCCFRASCSSSWILDFGLRAMYFLVDINLVALDCAKFCLLFAWG
jgi:hypothetical protein